MGPRDRRRALMEDAALATAAAALLWAGAMGFARSLQADEEKAKPVLSPAAEKKLDQAIDNDAVILSRFDAIMSEVEIVKVRVIRKPETPP